MNRIVSYCCVQIVLWDWKNPVFIWVCFPDPLAYQIRLSDGDCFVANPFFFKYFSQLLCPEWSWIILETRSISFFTPTCYILKYLAFGDFHLKLYPLVPLTSFCGIPFGTNDVYSEEVLLESEKTSIDNEDIVSSQDENEVGVSAVFQEYRTECFYVNHGHLF